MGSNAARTPQTTGRSLEGAKAACALLAVAGGLLATASCDDRPGEKADGAAPTAPRVPESERIVESGWQYDVTLVRGSLYGWSATAEYGAGKLRVRVRLRNASGRPREISVPVVVIFDRDARELSSLGATIFSSCPQRPSERGSCLVAPGESCELLTTVMLSEAEARSVVRAHYRGRSVVEGEEELVFGISR